MKICIDAGHGGTDPGALGQRSREADINLAIALALEDVLLQRGFDTVMTRRIDRNLTPRSRAVFANRYGANLFVSIHCNGGQPSAQGMECWIYPGSTLSRPYASSIQTELVKAFPTHRDRGIKEANFRVLRETAMAAVLVECEFLTNRRQERFLSSCNNQKKIAVAIADGIEFATQTV